MLSIGQHAFADTWLKHVTIPRDVEHLGEGAFESCRELRSAKLEVTAIPRKSFSECTSIDNLAILLVTRIGDSAFESTAIGSAELC